MKPVLLVFVGLLFAPAAFGSARPCQNYAKYAAIRAYKAEMGTVQGSTGIEYSAHLEKKKGNLVEYTVTITDNNEDGEVWDVDYRVKLRAKDGTCEILNVKKTAVRP